MSSRGSRMSYVIGFVVSVVLTLTAYFAAVGRLMPVRMTVAIITGLALVQLAVQLRLFLHLGQEAKPRWNLVAFGFMVLVVAILVGGSLWIMNNLNYHMMP